MNETEIASEHLIRAVLTGNSKWAKEIVYEGVCDVNYLSESAASPLSVAVSHNDLNMTTFLLENGADPHSGMGLETLLGFSENNSEIFCLLNQY